MATVKYGDMKRHNQVIKAKRDAARKKRKKWGATNAGEMIKMLQKRGDTKAIGKMRRFLNNKAK